VINVQHNIPVLDQWINHCHKPVENQWSLVSSRHIDYLLLENKQTYIHTYITFNKHKTEWRGQVVTTPASYSGGHKLKSRLGHRLSWGFLSPSRQTACFHIPSSPLFINHPINRRYVVWATDNTVTNRNKYPYCFPTFFINLNNRNWENVLPVPWGMQGEVEVQPHVLTSVLDVREWAACYSVPNLIRTTAWCIFQNTVRAQSQAAYSQTTEITRVASLISLKAWCRLRTSTLFCVVLSCVVRGLKTCRSLMQGILPIIVEVWRFLSMVLYNM
jgi:hypothetical protein